MADAASMLAEFAPVAQCNRHTMFKGKNVKPQWCVTCQAFLNLRELCPVIAVRANINPKERPHV